ncbi:hypothetical protein FRB95_004807 [Tulasnella sp. JGI-2019a]|nr:hypothetical protein FRB95_004807 [Tulasnella sp. JGI-2019a]
MKCHNPQARIAAVAAILHRSAHPVVDSLTAHQFGRQPAKPGTYTVRQTLRSGRIKDEDQTCRTRCRRVDSTTKVDGEKENELAYELADRGDFMEADGPKRDILPAPKGGFR